MIDVILLIILFYASWITLFISVSIFVIVSDLLAIVFRFLRIPQAIKYIPNIKQVKYIKQKTGLQLAFDSIINIIQKQP